MGETGKRYRSQRDSDHKNYRDSDNTNHRDSDFKNQKRRVNNDREEKSGGDTLVIYRILCPNEVIGSVIGKSGKVINSIRQDTRAKVKVVDPFPGAKDRVLTIYCYVKDKEEVDVDDEYNDERILCPAQEALLKVHDAIVDSLASARDSDRNGNRDKDECQILVPSSQSANVIGKAGVTIKRLRSRTRANIRVIPKDSSDPTHSCAMEFDNFVSISGDSDSVKRALFAVSAIMYKFPHREEISLETTVPEALPSIIIPSDVPIYTGGGFYSSADSFVPPRSLPPVMGTSNGPEILGYGDTGSAWPPIYSSALPVISGFGGGSRSEELVLRILCPFDKIGRVIGKGGMTVKSIRQASGARIEVDDKKEDRKECIITVISSESSDDIKSMAVEAFLLLQAKINDEEDEAVTIRLLVPSKVIGCIIGKSGSIINEIRKRTKADIRVSKGEKPKCASVNDELVEVYGESSSVRDALVQIVLRLRDDALKDKDGGRHHRSAGADSHYSSGSGISMPSLPPVTHLSFDRRPETGSGLGGMLSSSNIYGYGSLPMEENNGYRSMSSYSSKAYGGLPTPSTVEMLIPSNAVGKVLGKGGANIANIRKISGAVIEISESKSSWGDRMALISGTSDEKRSAENLIQAFIMAT